MLLSIKNDGLLNEVMYFLQGSGTNILQLEYMMND